MTLRADVLDTMSALVALAPEWSALCRRDRTATPFQRPEWLIPWARAFVRGPVVTVTVRRDGDLACVLPLFHWETDGERRLCLLGEGTSDYLDAVVDDADDGAAVAAALAVLRERGGWDVCEWDQLRSSSALARSPCEGFASERSEGEVCPRLRVDPADGLEGVVPPHTLAKLRRYRRRAAREGTVTLEIADASNADARLDDLLRFNAMRWSRAPRAQERPQRPAHHPDRPAHLDPPRAFRHEATRSLVSVGALRLYTLHLGGAVIAALYALAEHGRLLMYMQGFDPELASLSPGALILGAVLEDAVALGARELDFLRGREPYKYTWGAVDRPTLRRRLSRAS